MFLLDKKIPLKRAGPLQGHETEESLMKDSMTRNKEHVSRQESRLIVLQKSILKPKQSDKKST